MPRATLDSILNDIRGLEREELVQVRSAVEAQLTSPAQEDAEDTFLQSMLDSGLITDVKRPDRSQTRERSLVTIQGKPLSETIIDERR